MIIRSLRTSRLKRRWTKQTAGRGRVGQYYGVLGRTEVSEQSVRMVDIKTKLPLQRDDKRVAAMLRVLVEVEVEVFGRPADAE